MWIGYIIALILYILLYNMLKQSYRYTEDCFRKNTGFYSDELELIEDSVATERVKYPLIIYIVMGITFFIPFINIIMALAFIINLIIQYYLMIRILYIKQVKLLHFSLKRFKFTY